MTQLLTHFPLGYAAQHLFAQGFALLGEDFALACGIPNPYARSFGQEFSRTGPLQSGSPPELDTAEALIPCGEEILLSHYYQRFCECGGHVYALAAELTQAFEHIGIGAISLQGLTLPHPAFYLHFGHRLGLNIGPAHLEGAFVLKGPQGLGLHFIYSKPTTLQWVSGVAIAVEEEDLKMPAEAAFASSLEKIRSFEEQARLTTHGNAARQHRIEDVQAKFTQMELACDALERALPLVANSLIYLGNCPQAAAYTWALSLPEDAGAFAPQPGPAGRIHLVSS